MLIAVDTNVLFDLASDVETVADAFATTLILKGFDVTVPVIATPREIVQKLFH